MKRVVAIVLAIYLLCAVGAHAASSMTPSLYSISQNQSFLVVKLACIAETDGTFTNKTLTHAEVFGAGSYLPVEYKYMGYYLVTAWAVNPAATYPTSGAVTITSASGLQLIGSVAGDTLTLSTASTGVAQITNSILPIKRPIADVLTIAVTDTGTAANQFSLYLLFARPWIP